MKLFQVVLGLGVLTCMSASAEQPAEDKALGFLAREVPRWSSQHHCFSCHNNGDAARALYTGIRQGRPIPPEVTADTDRWLAKPEGWEKNGGDGPFSDRRLARIQFASALASGLNAGRVVDRETLIRVAVRLVEDQAEDGSWNGDAEGQLGTPATYGRRLSTWSARETLRSADSARFKGPIDRANAWLGRQPIANVFEASTVLLSRAYDDSPSGIERLRSSLDLLRRGQSPEGGWGPYVLSSPETFDTALALLALDGLRDQPGIPSMIARGRSYLVENQQDDGSWIETTRPAGAESYAQRLSTTGWATQALLIVKSP